MILVFGSSGNIGGRLIRELAAKGEAVRAVYRSRKPDVAGVETVQLDLEKVGSLEEAFRGVEKVFLLSGDMADQVGAELRVVEAAKMAGVKHLVKLSAYGAQEDAYTFARIHRRVERAIIDSGVPHTFLRPGSFMQNFINHYGEMIRTANAFFLPCGDAREAHIHTDDIARCATAVLTGHGHEGAAYDLTGPEAFGYADAAAMISRAVGREIAYVPVSEDEFRAGAAEQGIPDDYTDALADLYRFIRESGGYPPTSAVRELTGRDGVRFEEFAEENKGRW